MCGVTMIMIKNNIKEKIYFSVKRGFKEMVIQLPLSNSRLYKLNDLGESREITKEGSGKF